MTDQRIERVLRLPAHIDRVVFGVLIDTLPGDGKQRVPIHRLQLYVEPGRIQLRFY